MPDQHVQLETRDGICPTHVFTPDGEGPWPGVILYMDALAIRPALIGNARHLAGAGYVVLLPDLYYRTGPYPPFVPAEVFAQGLRETIGPMMASINPTKIAEDTAAFLAYLDTRSDVKGDKVGVSGYCMGGALAITAAATYPHRIAAVGAFHAGNLATDAETSPHLLLPKLEAELYIGAADKDSSYPPEMEARFRAALDAAGVTYRHELYEGAAHGWTMPDFPIYDADAAERHWRELIALFKRTIG